MKGDYFRYIAEFKNEAEEAREKEMVATQASQAYKDALLHAEESLGPADPIRLGVALNWSVFFNEVMQNSEEAISLARSTAQAAMTEFPSMSEDQKRDSRQILQLLNDNL